MPAFLFDLDGTLADTLPDLAASTNYVREQNGLQAVDDATVRTYVGDGARTLLRRSLAELQPDDNAIEAAFATYIEHHRAQCTVHAELFPGALEYLSRLREQDYAIAVVTNKPEQFAIPVVRHLGLDQFASVVIGGDTLPTKKPDPAMLKHALDMLGSTTEQATMIGDGLPDLRAGKALKIQTIGCLFGYGCPEALRSEGADVFWHKFAEPESR